MNVSITNLNALLRTQTIHFCQFYKQKTNLAMPAIIAQKGVFDAFKYASTITYPTIPSDWKGISYGEAVNRLNGFCSKNTLIRMARQGYFRTNEQNQLYDGEIKELQKILEVGKILEESGVLTRVGDIKGHKYYGLLPEAMTKQGKSKQYQYGKALASLIKAPFFQNWLANVEDTI